MNSTNQGPLSPPSSVAGSEWSVGRYQTSSPKPYKSRSKLATPPISGSSSNGLFVPNMNGMGPGSNGPRPGDLRGNPSPPSSVGRSSNGTQVSSETQRRKQSTMEDSLGQHYVSLKRYLAASLQNEQNDGRPNRARDKLVRLSPTQFQELSTDVYDELLRRQATQAGTLPPSTPGYLPPRDTFHPKRNQARQKLSTLPGPRFRALATDVFFELERRFPRFSIGNIGRGGSPAIGPPSRTGTPNGMRPSSGTSQIRRPPPRQGSLGGQVLAGGMPGMADGPMQKSSQSSTIVPNKSYLVEDDDEGDLDSVYGGNRRDTTQTNKSSSANEKIIADYQTKVEELQEKIARLEKQLQEKDESIGKVTADHQDASRDRNNASAEWSRLRLDLEEKVTDAQHLNESLQSEIDRLKSHHSEKERDFQDQLDLLAQRGSDSAEWRSRYENVQRNNEDLQQMNDSLQRDLQDYQRVTEEVRREAAGFLSEMKAISDRSDASYQREEKLNQEVMRMEEEIREWKSRYAKVKTQIRGPITGSMSIAVQQPGMAKEGFTQPNGLVKDVHITRFQLAIDDFIRASRETDQAAILNALKSVVAAVKSICEEIPDNTTDDPTSQQYLKLRNKVNATASNFITAAKNHMSSNGISPISLVDAAASHLATAVVELIHLVKMRPTPPGELEVDDEASVPYPEISSRYFSSNGRSSVTESVYSNNTAAARASQKMSILPNTSYRAPSTNGMPNGKIEHQARPSFDVHERDEDVKELRLLLDDRNATLVDTTQVLISSIRSSAPAQKVLPLAGNIADIVSSILQRADPVLNASPALNSAAGPVMQNLSQAKAKLLTAEDDGRNARSEEEWKGVINRMPPIAFEIARVVRELGTVLTGADDEEDDFR